MGDRCAVECACRDADHQVRGDTRLEEGQQLAGLHRAERSATGQHERDSLLPERAVVESLPVPPHATSSAFDPAT